MITACGVSVPEVPPLPFDEKDDLPKEQSEAAVVIEKKLPLWRKLLAFAAGATTLAAIIIALSEPDISWLTNDNKMGFYIILIMSALLLAAAVNQKGRPPIENEQTGKDKRRLSKRTSIAALMILLAILLTIYIGIFYLGDRKYYFIAMLIILETMLPFFLIFEGRKPQARELVIISVLCAIGVAGRAAFFMLPQFKPVAALVIIFGVTFGGEGGFWVGGRYDADFQYDVRTGALDAMADVRHGYYRLSGRCVVSQRIAKEKPFAARNFWWSGDHSCLRRLDESLVCYNVSRTSNMADVFNGLPSGFSL